MLDIGLKTSEANRPKPRGSGLEVTTILPATLPWIDPAFSQTWLKTSPQDMGRRSVLIGFPGSVLRPFHNTPLVSDEDKGTKPTGLPVVGRFGVRSKPFSEQTILLLFSLSGCCGKSRPNAEIQSAGRTFAPPPPTLEPSSGIASASFRRPLRWCFPRFASNSKKWYQLQKKTHPYVLVFTCLGWIYQSGVRVKNTAHV